MEFHVEMYLAGRAPLQALR